MSARDVIKRTHRAYGGMVEGLYDAIITDLDAAGYEIAEKGTTTRLAEVERERDEAVERIENAQQSMSETQPSWERRCYSIMAALGLDYGKPTPDIPEQSGWYARNLKLAETALSSALAERDDAVATVKLLQDQFKQQQDHDGKILDAALAENERLKAALERAGRILTYPVATCITPSGYGLRTDDDSVGHAVETIRTTLNGGTPNDPVS